MIRAAVAARDLASVAGPFDWAGSVPLDGLADFSSTHSAFTLVTRYIPEPGTTGERVLLDTMNASESNYRVFLGHHRENNTLRLFTPDASASSTRVLATGISATIVVRMNTTEAALYLNGEQLFSTDRVFLRGTLPQTRQIRLGADTVGARPSRMKYSVFYPRFLSRPEIETTSRWLENVTRLGSSLVK